MAYKTPLVAFTTNVSLAEKQALEDAARAAVVSRASYVRSVLAAHLAQLNSVQAAP